MVRGEALASAHGVVAAADFFRDAHQRVYAAMLALDARGTAVDFLTIREELGRTGDLDECGGPAYLSALSDGIPSTANVSSYAAIVREKARLRDLILAANEVLAEAYAAEEPAADLIGQAVERLSAIPAGGRRGAVLADDAVSAYLAGLDVEGGQAYQTGYADIDALTGGLRSRELAIIAARPSVGKSAIALGMAEHVARAGHVVGYFSPEMSQEQLAARLLGWRSGVPSACLERKTATDEQWAAVSAAMVGFAGLPLHLDDSSRTVAEVVAWCRRMKPQGLAVVFVDYLQLLLPSRVGRSREEDVAAISSSLKQQVAKDLGVAVVALSQLNRGSDDRRDKRPSLSDLRESGALEQDADLAILLFREEMHKPKPENAGIAEAIVAKQRNGPVGVVRLAFDRSLAIFRNLAQDQEPS